MTAPTDALRPTSSVVVHAAAVTPPRAGRRRLGRRLTPYLFLVAPVILLLIFTYIPAGSLFWYSLTSWDGLSPVKKFIGFKNYQTVMTRPELFRVFFVSLYYLAASVVQIALALYFATVLSFKVRFKSFFKGVLFFPFLLNGVAIAFIFLYCFQPGGTLDQVAHLFGWSDPPQWLGSSRINNISLAGTSVWRYMGLNFVLFLGAIQSIPRHLYEAAEIDGATRWQIFRYIIAPGIKPIISLMAILAISGSLSAFEIPFIMTHGANGSATFVVQTVKVAFESNKVGLASAMAVILLFIVLFVTWLQRRIVPDERVSLT